MKNKPGARSQNAEVRRAASSSRRLGDRLCFLLPFVCLLASASAQQPRRSVAAPSGPLTYDSFRLLHTRNVFDPDRRPVRPANSGYTAPVGRSDYLVLTGTLIDNEKTYAFFSGSRADFNKVLSVRDKISNATITQITPLNIVVERGGKRVNVLVGQTVPLDDKSVPGAAPSNVAEVTATSIERPANPGTGDTPPTAPAPAAGGGGAPAGAAPATGSAPADPGAGTAKGATASKEEIMRRMMEKRKQELK